MYASGTPSELGSVAEYLEVPPLLISTTGLEGYLASLSRQLGRDIGDVRRRVAESAAVVAATGESVTDIKRCIGASALASMQKILAESDPARQTEIDQSFSDMFANDAAVLSDAEIFTGMLAMSKKVMSESVHLRRALQESTEATRNFIENQVDINRELAEANYRIKCYQRDFHELSLWLGTFEVQSQMTRSFPTASDRAAPPGPAGAVFENAALAVATDAELEGAVAQSPLLLAFRRILLRDMVDRVTHTTDMQSREVGSVVAELKEDIGRCITSEGTVDVLESRQANEARALMGTYATRLKGIEDTYVRRDEFTTLMKSKADTMLMPVKADSAVVVTLERRMFDRYSELEERIAYFEAEREEFRAIVRSLLALQQQHQVTSRGGSAQGLPSPLPAIPPSMMANTRTDGSGKGYTGTATSQPTAAAAAVDLRMSAGQGTSSDATGRSVYRVIGADRTAFATAVTDGGAFSHSGRTSSRKHGQPRKPAAPAAALPERASTPQPPTEAERRQFIGMTANQVAYAYQVSGELSREDVSRLPVLPYESAR